MSQTIVASRYTLTQNYGYDPVNRLKIAVAGAAVPGSIPGFGWHTFRRQNITLIQEEGAAPFEAQAQAGHSKPMMTSAYTLIGLDRREKAVRKVQLRLLKKTG